MTPAFTHCAIHVADLQETVAFYERYCAMRVVRAHGTRERTVWMASPGQETTFVLVLISGGQRHERTSADMTHYGFAVADREAIDAIAARARAEARLVWEPMELAPPVGYLCGVEDPNGYVVEFSYGQPLGPGCGTADGDGKADAGGR